MSGQLGKIQLAAVHGLSDGLGFLAGLHHGVAHGPGGAGGRGDGLRGGEKLLAFHPRERFAAAGAGFEMIVHESAARVRAAFVGVER